MRKVTTLTGKNLPRLAVAKPGWPETKPLQMAIGVTTIVYEIRRENDANVFGCRVNGEFRETCRLIPAEDEITPNQNRPRQPEG